MTFPLPTNPTHVGVPPVYEAVGRFLLQYAVPAVPQANIIKGNQNRIALPKGTNEYIIMTVLNHFRHGTNVYEFDARQVPHEADGTDITKELVEIEVQIDCYSDTDAGRQRATAIEMMARSPCWKCKSTSGFIVYHSKSTPVAFEFIVIYTHKQTRRPQP